MFKGIEKKFPLLTDKLESVTGLNGNKFPDLKNELSWFDLQRLGIVKESVTDTDEGTVEIERTFISYDQTMTKRDIYVLDSAVFKKYKEEMTEEGILEEIEELEEELEEIAYMKQDDSFAVIVDQLKFLKDQFNIK